MFKIGCDPEFFILKNGNPYPAIGLIGGTKENPLSTDREGCFMQEDNVMAEFNVPPSEDPKELFDNMQHTIEYIAKRLPDDSFSTLIVPSLEFDPKILLHPQALVFGCDPDYNCWTLAINTPPDVHTNLRTAGGHVHVGYDNPTMEKSVELLKLMDYYIGIPSVLLDLDTKRRKIYGKAGAFRMKSYGFEYRVLSNFWIKDLESVEFIFKGVKKCFNAYDNGKRLSDKEGKKIQEIINTSNASEATLMLTEIV
jgi:hypothetical protein